MLESFRKGQRWLSLIFVSVIGLVFVFFLGVGGGVGPGTPTGNVILQLDDEKLTSRDFEREKANLEARMRQELGESFDRNTARSYIESQALGALTNSVVLAAAAAEMGLHVSQDELRRVVQRSPIFIDAEGRFSPEAFDRFAAYQYGSQRAFIHGFTRSLLGQKLVMLLIGQTVLSDAEVDLRTRYELEEARIAYVTIAPTPPGGDDLLEDSDIAAYAIEHEDQLRANFDERADEFIEPERVRARHILVLAGPDDSEEEASSALERAESARLRIEQGEDFSAIAREISEDAGTAKNGGDLGLFAHAENHPALSDAAFALEVAEVSSVVRSVQGFHVIRVDERLEPEVATFESKRLTLAREALLLAEAFDRANQLSQRLADAIEAGSSLEDAAREAGLPVQRPPGLKRRSDGFVPGLGAAADLLTTAFTLEAGESSPEVFGIAGRQVLIQVLERSGPDSTTVTNERLRRRELARSEKENRILQAWIDDYRSQLEASGRLRINAELAFGS